MPPNQPPPARKRPTSSQPPVANGSRPSGPRPAPGAAARPARPESKLVCTAGPKAGTEFPLVGEEDVVLGRATDNAISIPDTSVSRKHVQLRRVSDGWAASDMGSGNGTLVNGEKIAEETVLRSGDTLAMGDTVFTFEELGDTARRAPPARRGSNPGSAALARRSGVPPRASLAGRPDVRARLSGRNAPVDPDAAKKKKRMVLLGVTAVLLVVVGLVGVKIKKMAKEAQEADEIARKTQARQALSVVFQDAKNLIRSGEWTQAKAKLDEIKSQRPDYPGVDDYLERAAKEIPNEANLKAATVALKKDDVPAAAEALTKVGADTQQFAKLNQLQDDLRSRKSKLMSDAQVAMGNNDIDKVKLYTDIILRVEPNDRDAKALNDQAVAAIAIRDRPAEVVKGPAPKPWEAGISRFLDGDLTGAIALEDECANRKVPRCRTAAQEMREFGDIYKRLDDLDAKGLNHLLALDKEVTEGRRSKLARTAGIKLAASLCKSATSAKSSGQYARAGELAQRAIQADPNDPCASSILNDLKAKAHDMYMQAYSLKDSDPDQAIEKFKMVLQMTTPDSEEHEKAQKRINELMGNR